MQRVHSGHVYDYRGQIALPEHSIAARLLELDSLLVGRSDVMLAAFWKMLAMLATLLGALLGARFSQPQWTQCTPCRASMCLEIVTACVNGRMQSSIDILSAKASKNLVPENLVTDIKFPVAQNRVIRNMRHALEVRSLTGHRSCELMICRTC
jgi:hypothetical protein